MRDSDIKQRLLGFHLRILPELCAGRIWTPDNRQAYLLNPETAQPLTADEMMWPGLEEDELQPLLESFMRRKGYTWSQLYSDVALLKDIPEAWFTLSSGGWSEKAWLMAFSVESVVAEELEKIYGKLNVTGMDVPDIVAIGWCLIGYDVVDEGSISGLMNCGYRPGEQDALVQYIPFLNEYGLFSSLSRAREFCEKTDRRVPEHAPFYVKGIWAHPSNKGLDKRRCVE